MSSRSAAKTFLANYTLDDAYLVKSDRASGRAGLVRARGPSGEVLIKIWPRQKGLNDKDLEDIWRSELRQLQRLAAVPGASEYFVPVRASGKDAQGFYLVMDPGQGSPLAEYLNAARKPDLLARNRQPRARRVLWDNARRLAEGLELLHGQGIIHRNLDPWSVITAFTPEADARITGFEWSMRIASLSGGKQQKPQKEISEHPVSFARDWFNLALLIARLLDIPEGPLADIQIVPSEVAEHTTAAEVRLLRAMLGAERIDRLDGEYVVAQISVILDAIESEAAGKDARLCLSVRLGTDSRLSQAIRTASDKQIEIDDHDQQIHFILNDLADQSLLVRLKDDNYALVGDRLTYRLNPYQHPRSTDEPTFEFASCDRAEADPPAGVVRGRTMFSRTALDIVPSHIANQNFPRRRGKVQPWDDLLARTLPHQMQKTDLDRMHEALALLVVLEMAYAAADMFPVEIKSMHAASKPETYSVILVPRGDKERSKLSEVLQLGPPAVRLEKLLDSDDVREDGGWTLAEPSMLGEHSAGATTWRFVGSTEIDGLECLNFEGTAPVTQFGDAFLTPAGMTGRIAQFKRRLKALAALRQHTELLGMLADARGRISDSHDPLDVADDKFKALDRSKQDALREILATIPLFLLQGPPGVGKTYLAADVVRRRFEEEPTSRMLLSAQSNSAIDHLMSDVESIFRELPMEQRPLIVRARPVDDDDSVGEFEIDVQADNLLRSLVDSPLVAAAPAHLRERVRDLADAASRTGTSPRLVSRDVVARRTTSELRAFEGMILRAANLVFATTNSYAVERLIDERSLFDWSIVEEAGKATGGELLSPLLLSHRRLMIGDHKQLPPFDIDKITTLLTSVNSVAQAISLADSLISRYLKDPSVDDIFRELRTYDGDLGPVCATTLNMLTLFETLIEAELKRQKRQPQGRPIARRLTEQYRMHPAIARVVSHCFYDGELVTNRDKERTFLSKQAPFQSVDSGRLPEAPIVFIDMPYCREDKPGGRTGDRLPPWSNPGEADVAMTTLQLLRARKDERPSLAILSPYRQQVSTLSQKLKNYIEGGSLDHISGFAPAIADTDYCGTVDSFQGAEADLVLISLVRNNVHSTPARALGFLRDNRRMNVLLSRAKWRLVLLGSLSFYRNVVATSAVLPDHDVGFLVKFLQALDSAVETGEAAIVPLATLNGVKA